MADGGDARRAGRSAFADWLRAQMADRGMTQAELAEAVGVTPAAVSWWATGRAAPTRPSLERLAAALGLGLVEVLRAAEGGVGGAPGHKPRAA